jgi:hypothetical protein
MKFRIYLSFECGSYCHQGWGTMATSCWRVTRFIVLLLIALGELGLISYLVWTGHLFIEYFTYMNKVVFMLVLWIIIIANIDYMAFQWLITIFLPFLVAVGLTVAIGVTMLAYCRPLLIIDDMNSTDGDPDGIALVHTGDWLFHQLPFVEAVIIAFCLYKEASCALRYQLDKQITSTVGRAAFIIFVCSLHAIFAGFYCVIAPFSHVYMLGPPAEAAIPAGLMVAITILAGVIVYVMFFIVIGQYPNSKDAGSTLWTVAALAKRRQIQEHIDDHNRRATADGITQTGRAKHTDDRNFFITRIDRPPATLSQ